MDYGDFHIKRIIPILVSWYLEEFSPIGAPYEMYANVLSLPTTPLTGPL